MLLLMQNKVNVNVVNQDGNTPLYLAVKSNNEEVIDILIKNGADIDAVNNNGDNVAEISSSSESSGVQPTGYNIVSWIKGAVSMLTGINPAEQVKKNVRFNVDDA